MICSSRFKSSPKTCPLVKLEIVISGHGGALPACEPDLRRASSPEGEPMSFAQLSLLEPHAPRTRLRHVRRPFTPSCEGGPYRLPHDVQAHLGTALAQYRNRDAAFALAVFIGRFWSAPGRLEQAFPIDRRALANRPDLGLTEAKVRGAIRTLVLQLSLRVGFALMALPVTVLGHGLMDAPPQRPAEEMIEHYAGRTLQAANELADLAHAEGDQRSRLRSPLLCDVTALSFTRRAARKPKASMASVMCRYQPCQERIS